MAAASATASGVTAALVVWLATTGNMGASLAGACAVAIVSGFVANRMVHMRISTRLELAQNALRETRKRRFEALAALPRGADRDEVDALFLQVTRTGQALQKEIERLETAESFRRDFLGDVSHELRTSIFAVAGFAETLLDGALDDQRVRRRFLEKILANAGRLDSLTRDLTAIADLETGRLQMQRVAVVLPTLVQEAVDALVQRAKDQGISVSNRIPDDLPRVVADRDKLRQVLSNLIENAIKYNNPGGTVEVVGRLLADGEVRVSVSDDGIGIPSEAVPRLTERFFRVDKSRSREQGGTGLGLAIVKHILEAHGQRLSIESRTGYGSSFAFSLPGEVPTSRGSS